MVGGRDEGKYEFGFRVVEVLILGAADVRRPPPAGAPLFKVTQLIINIFNLAHVCACWWVAYRRESSRMMKFE